MSMVGEDPKHEQRPARSGGPSAVEEAHRIIDQSDPRLTVALAIRNAEKLDRLRAERSAALDLLAVIHRDGGHHTEGVGFIKSCSDAIAVRNALVVDNDRLRAENERLEKLLAANEGRIEKIVSDELLQRAERAEAALAKGVVVPEEPSVSILLAMSKWFTGDTHAIKRRDCYAELLAAAKEGKSNG